MSQGVTTRGKVHQQMQESASRIHSHPVHLVAISEVPSVSLGYIAHDSKSSMSLDQVLSMACTTQSDSPKLGWGLDLR